MITKELLSTAAANFEKRAKNLKNFDEKKIEKKSIKYTFRQIKEGIVDIEQLKSYRKNPAIYVLRTTEDKSKELNSIYNNLDRTGEFKYSHNNKNKGKAENLSKTVLYVGKSNDHINTRLLQHLTEMSKSTFSLHLSTWNLDKLLDVCLFIDIYFFHHDDDEKHSQDVEEKIQDIEDALWSELKPMFGKLGKNTTKH